jgi:quercetin dioxygenase-like cupin family protein
MIRVFDPSCEGTPLPMISRRARLVVWSGVGARQAQMNYVILEPQEANVPHRHEHSEDTIFVIEGRGTVSNLDRQTAYPVTAGQIVHVPEGIAHAVRAVTRMISLGGPVPPDEAMIRRAGLLPS